MTSFTLPPDIKDYSDTNKFVADLVAWSRKVHVHLDHEPMDQLEQAAIAKWRKRAGGHAHEQPPFGQLDHIVINHVRHAHTWYDEYSSLISDEYNNPTFLTLKFLVLKEIQKGYPVLAKACRAQWWSLNKDVELSDTAALRDVVVNVTRRYIKPQTLKHQMPVHKHQAVHRPFQNLQHMVGA